MKVKELNPYSLVRGLVDKTVHGGVATGVPCKICVGYPAVINQLMSLASDPRQKQLGL